MIFAGKAKVNDLKIQVEKQRSEYENALFGQKERIIDLREENRRIKEELEQYKKKDKQIASALLLAQQKAKEIEDNARLASALEMKRLSDFHQKWLRYYDGIKKLFPQDPALQSAGSFLKKMEAMLAGDGKRPAASADVQLLRRHHDAESRRLSDTSPEGSDDIAAARHISADDSAGINRKLSEETASATADFSRKLSEIRAYIEGEGTAAAETYSAQNAPSERQDYSEMLHNESASLSAPDLEREQSRQPNPASPQPLFDLSEVLNPKNLQSLEELCDEMELK